MRLRRGGEYSEVGWRSFCSFGDESEVRDGGLPQLCAGGDG